MGHVSGFCLTWRVTQMFTHLFGLKVPGLLSFSQLVNQMSQVCAPEPSMTLPFIFPGIENIAISTLPQQTERLLQNCPISTCL